jgi:small conductance mechanosensitive channel
MKIIPVTLLATALFFPLGTVQVACAEQSAAVTAGVSAGQSEPITADAEKIRKLLDEIAAQTEALGLLKNEILTLNTELKKAQNEEQAVLHNQHRHKYAELQDGLRDLVKNLIELESQGRDVADVRKTAAAFSGQVSVWLKDEISSSLKVLDRLEEQIKTASEPDLPEIRNLIANERKAVDEELAALLENSNRLELLGLDSAPDLKYLDQTLIQRADILTATLQYLIEQRDGLRKQVTGAGEDEKKRLKEKVASLDGRISSTAVNLKTTIDLMGERNLEAARYKQILISSTGEITKDVFESEVALGLLQQWLDSGKEWLIDNGPQWVFKLVVFVLILLLFALLANIAKRIISRALASSRLHASKLLQNLLVSFVGKAIFLVGILIALAQLGIKIGPVLAGLGIVGFIIGFALQETLSNFASGIMILVYRPFDVGDSIETGGVSGKVKQMNLVSTTITTFDNQRLIVPNRKIWGDVIRNVNAEKIRRIDMVFGIGYDDDIDLAEQVLHEIVDHHDMVLDDPPPVIRLHTLGESSIDFIVRPWVKTDDYWTAYWNITRDVKRRFDEEGISIPFPQQDMHIYHHGNGSTNPPSEGSRTV